MKFSEIKDILQRICNEVGFVGASIVYSNTDELLLMIWDGSKKKSITMDKSFLNTEMNDQQVSDMIEWLKKEYENE